MRKNKLSVFFVFDLVNQLWRWVSQKLGDHIQLFLLRTSWQEWLSNDKLSEDAPKRPHVDRHAVGKPKDHLWRAIETALDVRVHALMVEAGGTKINDLNVKRRQEFQVNSNERPSTSCGCGCG